MGHDYLSDLLDAYWFAPPVALWRAIELRALARQRFARPILDLGCGDGLVAEALFGAAGWIDVGFDPWISQLRRAQSSRMYAHLDLANGESLPYHSETFATVLSNSVLEHIADPAPVVRETSRVLREGGRFIFTVPSDHFRRLLDGYVRRAAAGDMAGAEAYARSVDVLLEHHHYHPPDEWRSILSGCGLDLETAEYYAPGQAVGLWDRMNRRFGIGRERSLWSLIASPSLRGAIFQRALRRLVVRRLSRAWCSAYDADVAEGEPGGGLLIVGRKS